jgi:ubiquinone/menaquinone biosynthesis C-methylase UbiE
MSANATRFAGDTSVHTPHFLRTAERYVANLRAEERVGLYQKPLDHHAGHPSFFRTLYQALNILQAMELPAGARVAEVGSGSGWLTELLAGLGYEVWALDPAAEMLAVARDRVRSFLEHHRFPPPYRVRFVCASLEACPLPDESVDAVLFHEALHHLPDENRALAECHRILTPGGVVGVSGESCWVPGNAEQEAFWQAEMDRFGTLESPFTFEYLHAKLREHGFADVRRYHGINRLVPVEQEGLPVKHLATQPAECFNNVTARKPCPADTTIDPKAHPHATIRLVQVERSPDGGEARVGMRLANTGRVTWVHEAPHAGYVTVALQARASERKPVAEGWPRARLPRSVRPGEEIELRHTWCLDPAVGGATWYADLVCEGRYWFSERGTTPVPVRF